LFLFPLLTWEGKISSRAESKKIVKQPLLYLREMLYMRQCLELPPALNKRLLRNLTLAKQAR